MPISVNPIFPVISAQGAAPDLVLQPGTVIDAQVLKILTNDLVRIAIANLSIEVLSEIPLQAGQTLQLAVSQTPNGIKLAVVGQGSATPASPASPVVARPGAAPANVISDSVTLAPDAPVTDAPGSIAASLVAVAPRNVLTPLEALAVSAAAQSAAPRQQSLAPLFANLGAVLGLDTLPPKLQQAVVQLLTLRPSLDQNLTGDDVKAAFQKSGLFLEASLAQESAAGAQESVVSTSGFPDLKAALIVLRQTLSSLSPIASQSASSPASTAPAPAAPATSTPSQQPQQPSYAPQAPYTAAGTVAASAAEVTSATEATAEPPPVPPFISAAPLAPEIDVQEIFLPQARLPVADDFTEWNGPAGLFAAQEAPPAASPRATPIIEVLNLVQEAQQSVSKDAANVAKSGFAESILSDPLEVLLDRASAAGLQKVFRSDSADIAATAHTTTPPPPFRGALPTAQPVALPSLAPDVPLANTVHHLLDDTDAAIARQTLLQVASLPDRIDGMAARTDPTAPRWNFEIPFAMPFGTAMAQFEISRDGGGNEIEAAKRVWRARFSLDVEPAGPVHALISLSGDKTSVRMWAERPATAAQLRGGASQLSQALSRAELQPGDIVIQQGAPAQAAPAPVGHFLDRAL